MDAELKKHVIKTGTTILGIVCKDGVVMAGDNRASLGGQLVANKNMQKVFPINNSLVVGVCGNATEAMKASKLLAAELMLKKLRSKKKATTREAASLLSNIPVKESAFILAGIDKNNGAAIYEITGGLMAEITDYTASVGSGLMYVLGYLERTWKKDLTIEEGTELAKEALKAAMERDMASGNGMNIFTLTKEGINEVVRDKAELTYTKRE